MAVTESKSVRQTGCILEEISSIKRNNAARTKRRVEIKSHWKASMCAKMGRKNKQWATWMCKVEDPDEMKPVWKDSGVSVPRIQGAGRKWARLERVKTERTPGLEERQMTGQARRESLASCMNYFEERGEECWVTESRGVTWSFFFSHCDKAILELPR